MRRIIFAVTTDLNYDQRMQRICGSLAANGFRVLLVGRTWKISKPLSVQPYSQHRLSCYFNKGKFFYIEYNIRLLFFLLFKHADAFCAADLDTALPVCLKARMANKPFIFDAHEYFTEVPEVVERPVIRNFWRWVEKLIVPKTELRYTVTASLATLFEQKYGAAFQVIRNITALYPFKNVQKPARYILYQGAVNEGRGLEMLLEVMPEIDAELWICGKGDIFDELVLKTKDLNLEKKVKFLGYVLPEALEKITREATIGVNLLQNKGLSYYFSLANKFFDYMHAGIPQVVINFPEYEALNRQYQVGITIPLEKNELKIALNSLLENEELYAKLAANCMVAREELNWQQEEKKLLALYENLWQKK